MFNLDDPKNQALIAMGLGLLGGAPRQNKNFGADLAHGGLLGLQAYAGAKDAQLRRQRDSRQDEMFQMQLAQARQAQEAAQQRQSALGALGQQRPDLAPLLQLDPALGISRAFPEAQRPVRMGSNDRLVDPATGQVMVDAQPEKPKMPEAGKLREIYRGGNVIQQEWTGEKWADVGQGPRFKPDAPERPPASQLYEGPNGPMWITPPGRGSGPVPVAGPDGKPLGPKKGEKGLTETQAKATLYTGMMQDAENAIAKLNFDPSTLKNQTDIALARGDLSYLPKSLQNVTSSATAQQYAQGTFQWTEAMLRQLTGAAAPEPEVWRQVKTYWPQPGDSKAVVERKSAARKQVADYVRIVAAGGADKADAATSAPKTNIEDLIKRYAR